MTREEAIEEIRYYCQNSEEIIQALEQEPCEDAVSRASVFEIMGNLMGIPYECDRQITEKDASESMDEIRNLPSVTPKGVTVTDFADKCRECGKLKKGKWIPVSERLPEKAGGYLVTSSINLGEKSPVREVHIDYFCKSLRKWLYEGEDVIAWKPLPEAYQEESEAKHD